MKVTLNVKPSLCKRCKRYIYLWNHSVLADLRLFYITNICCISRPIFGCYIDLCPLVIEYIFVDNGLIGYIIIDNILI